MTEWFARPADHVLVVYLRNDLKSEDALSLFRRVCVDHGLRVTRFDRSAGELVAECVGGQTEMELMARVGRHPVNGNMLLIEYNRYIAEKVAYVIAGVMLAVVVVAAVALVAAAVKDCDSKHLDSTLSGSHNALHGAAHIASGVAEGLARGSAYAAIDHAVYNPPKRIDVRTIIINHSADCTPAQRFGDRVEFFDYFYENTKRFFFNCGLIRLPSRDPLSGKAIPLKGVVRRHKMGGYATRLFVYDVTEAELEMSRLLRVDIVSSGPVVAYARHREKPSYRSHRSVHSKRIGSSMYRLCIGADEKHPLKPGPWYIVVASDTLFQWVEVTVAASMHTEHDTDAANVALVGRLSISTSGSRAGGKCTGAQGRRGNVGARSAHRVAGRADLSSSLASSQPPAYSGGCSSGMGEKQPLTSTTGSVAHVDGDDDDDGDDGWEVVDVEEPAHVPKPHSLSKRSAFRPVGEGDVLEDRLDQLVSEVLACSSRDEMTALQPVYQSLLQSPHLKRDAREFLRSFWEHHTARTEESHTHPLPPSTKSTVAATATRSAPSSDAPPAYTAAVEGDAQVHSDTHARPGDGNDDDDDEEAPAYSEVTPVTHASAPPLKQ